MTYSCIKPPFYDTVSVLEIYVQVTIFLIIFPPRIVKVPFPTGNLEIQKTKSVVDVTKTKCSTRLLWRTSSDVMTGHDFRHQVVTKS